MSRCICLCAFVCLSMAVGRAPADDPKDKKPENTLEGTWMLVSLEYDGLKLPEEKLANGTMTIKGNKYAFKMQEPQNDEEGNLTVDAGKKPATIDLDILTGRSKGKKQLGIYELNSTSLKLCFMDEGEKERPKEFSAKEAAKQTLFVFKKKM